MIVSRSQALGIVATFLQRGETEELDGQLTSNMLEEKLLAIAQAVRGLDSKRLPFEEADMKVLEALKNPKLVPSVFVVEDDTPKEPFKMEKASPEFFYRKKLDGVWKGGVYARAYDLKKDRQHKKGEGKDVLVTAFNDKGEADKLVTYLNLALEAFYSGGEMSITDGTVQAIPHSPMIGGAVSKVATGEYPNIDANKEEPDLKEHTITTDAAGIMLPSRRSEQKEALLDLFRERVRQDTKWGGPVHDYDHGLNYWTDLIEKLNKEAFECIEEDPMRVADFYKHLIEIAASAVAAAESVKRLLKEESGL